MVAPSSDSDGSEVQITQPPKGSFCGTPSRVTRARPAPDGAIERRVTPWVVGFSAALEVRRNSEMPGTCWIARSSRGSACSCCGVSRMIEKAASPGAGGRRAAVTTTAWTAAGGGVASTGVASNSSLPKGPR